MIPLTVREAPQGATWGVDVLQLPGVDVLRASLERRLPDPPVTKLTGLRLSEVGLATASAWMPASGWWQTAAGVFLAGTTAFVADMALGSSVLTSAPAGVGVTTSELSVSFLRAGTIRSQTITGRGRLIHATRSLGLAEASLTDARGRLLAHASSRCVLCRADPEILAARQLPEARASDLVGIAVHIGSRLLGLAEPGEVLVSSTVKDLVAGSGIEFDDRGEHPLRDIAGAWHLYAPRAS
jgi:uncharacterized protein (TIGR00369 family)